MLTPVILYLLDTAVSDAAPAASRGALVERGNMYPHAKRMASALSKTAPRASQANIVNGLTAACCAIVRNDTQSVGNQRALRSGRFSQLVYTQLHSGQVVSGAR